MRFFTSTHLITLCLALLLALALAPSAMADGKEVIRDCAQDGDLDKEYSDEELEDAYNNLPSDIDEYSDCREVIKRAQAGGRGSGDGSGDDDSSSGGSGSGSGSSGGSGSGGAEFGDDEAGSGGTASDQEELENRGDAARSGDAPGSSDLASSGGSGDSDSGMPTAALVAIILLVLAGLLGGLYMLRERLPQGLTSRIPGFGPGQGR